MKKIRKKRKKKKKNEKTEKKHKIQKKKGKCREKQKKKQKQLGAAQRGFPEKKHSVMICCTLTERYYTSTICPDL